MFRTSVFAFRAKLRYNSACLLEDSREAFVASQMSAQRTQEASDIRTLSGIEHIRHRLGMYIGAADIHGLHHLIYEVVDNSIDEAMAGRCDFIQVVLHNDFS